MGTCEGVIDREGCAEGSIVGCVSIGVSKSNFVQLTEIIGMMQWLQDA